MADRITLWRIDLRDLPGRILHIGIRTKNSFNSAINKLKFSSISSTPAQGIQDRTEILDAFERAAGRLCWVVYHDGGYTKAKEAEEAQAVVG